MSYKIGTAAGHYDLLKQIRRYVCGHAEPSVPAFVGVGDGTLDNLETTPASPAETWTITCTSAIANGGIFSVTGSVSGAQAAATVGTAYDNGTISFLLVDGATDFAVSDEFTFSTTVGELTTSGEAWEQLEWDDTVTNHYLHLKGLGLSGTEEIFAGIATYQSVPSDYYNFKVGVFAGWVPGQADDFAAQVGSSTGKGMPLWNQTIPYWLIVNGQRIIIAAKIETVYEISYIGKIVPYGSPQQYPYPVICGAPLISASTTRYSDTGHHFPFHKDGEINIRPVDGIWTICQKWPYSADFVNETYGKVRDTNSEYPLLPVILWKSTPNQFGELDGVFFISGYNNATENTVTIGGDTYLVLHNVWRTGFDDYVALKLA